MITADKFDRSLILILRLLMAWVFLDSGIWQLLDSHFSSASFLRETKILQGFFGFFASPERIGMTDFLVSWGNILVGLSLAFGLLTRVGGFFAVFLMLLYHLVHVDFPYFLTDRHFNFIVDYHIVYAAVVMYLVGRRAGRFWGLDAWLEGTAFLERHPVLRRVVCGRARSAR